MSVNTSTVHPTSSRSSSVSPANVVGFWDIGAYKDNVQRIRDGSEQLEELTKLVKERAEIESKYGKSLQVWYTKWHTFSDRQLPEGFVKQSLDGILSESKELARVHLAVKDRFNDETIGLFKKDNYHRSAIRGFKEAREIEEEFEKAQRQWKKLYEKVESTKKHYHSCCRAEKSAYIQMINSHADSSLSQDGADKARDRHDKCKQEVKKARSSYEQQLREITQFNNVYMENMAFVFEKCQQMELKRMKFVVEMLSGMQKVLVDLLSPPKLASIHKTMEESFATLGDTQLNADLKKWSMLHGTDVPANWPIYEEYTPEFRSISSTSTKSSAKNEGGVVLTKKILKSEDEMQRRSSIHGDMVVNNNCRQPSASSRLPCGSVSIQDVHSTTRSIQSSSNGGRSSHQPRRASSCESIQDNSTTNSDPPSSNPNSVNGDNGTVHSYTTNAKSTPSQMPVLEKGRSNGEQDQFETTDSFAMSTPQHPTVEKNASQKRGRTSSVLKEDKGIMNNHQYYAHIIQNNNNNSSSQKNGRDENHSPQIIYQAKEHSNGDGQVMAGTVKVLYDYKASDLDELSLVKGEYLEAIKGQDEMGWCTGIKNDKIGFFPAGYVCNVNR
uniref:Uncharacterized protein n=1 Tax=Ditylenchus dipsaci TaxID=166011 RepID=A0A915ENJ3_9BILA